MRGLALAVLLFAACDPIPAELAPGLCGPIVLPLEVVAAPDVELEAVDVALELWSDSPVPLFEARADRWEECSWGCLGAATVYHAELDDPDALADTALDVSDAGEVRACEVRLAAAWPADGVLLAHELGHCLGLAHTDDPESLMATSPHPWARPWPEEIAAVLGGCDGADEP